MIQLFGYLLVAAAFAVIGLLAIVMGRGRPMTPWLLGVSVTTLIWATVHTMLGLGYPAAAVVVDLAELFRLGAWLGLIACLLAILPVYRTVLRAVAAVWLGALMLGVAETISPDPGIVVSLRTALTGTVLVLIVVGLVLLERFFHHTPNRKQVAFICYAIGVALAIDLSGYSALLWLGGTGIGGVRAYVNVGAAALLIGASARQFNRERSFDLSHEMVFFTSTLTAVGIYIALAGIGGLVVQQLGGAWGHLVLLAFLAAAFFALLILVFSDTVRARFRVFVLKHFKRYKYDYRVEWQRFIQTMAGAVGEPEILRTSLRAMCSIVDSPGGVIWVADQAQTVYRPVASIPSGTDSCADVHASEALPAFLRDRGWIIDLSQFEREPGLYGMLTVPDCIRFDASWLVVPLLLGTRLVGFAVLNRGSVHSELNFEDHDLLKIVGRDVATHISQFEANRELAESRQFSAYSRLSAFMMHDLKNLVAQLSLVIKNADKYKRNPEFIDDSIMTIANSVTRMGRLIGQLSGSVVDAPVPRRVLLGEVLERAVKRCLDRKPNPKLKLPCNTLVMADPDRLVSAFEHVLRNAQEATTESGSIEISAAVVGKVVIVAIKDDGVGMEPGFVRERLFRPFETTKGSSGMGIGAYQVREYVRAIGGDVSVQSIPGRGTTFRISLPTAAEVAASA